MELNKENTKKIIKIITYALILFFILQNFGIVKNMFFNLISILSPFLFGIGLAFILNIPMSSFERKLFKSRKTKNNQAKQNPLKRPISIVISLILIILIIGFIIKLVIPQLISVIVMFAGNLPEFAYNIKEGALQLTEQYPEIRDQISNIEINWDQIINELMNFVKNFAGSFVTSSIGFVVSVIGGIFDSIVAIVFAVYILMSKEKLSEQLKKLIRAYLPENKAERMLDICALSKNTFSNFIAGQCIEAVILGTLCFLGMLLLRLPYAATISVFVGVTALIPIVGAFIGIILGAVLILSVSPIKSLIFICFLLILQQIESNVIYPKVVGNSVGLPGMWVLVAVIVGGGLGGMLGLLLGLPCVSVLYSILRNDVYERLKMKKA